VIEENKSNQEENKPVGGEGEVPQPPKPEEPKPVGESAKPAAPAAQPAVAPKPAAAKPATEMTRRSFISWLAVGWIAFAAGTTAALTAFMRYLFPNVLFEPPTSFKAGLPEDYLVGAVDERWKNKYGVWIVRTKEGFYALSTVCTHLGCIPNWQPGEAKFKCPCHGSGFYKTGINFEGPAPRPLERFKIVLAEDGQILIDKGRSFLQEKGQWDDPDSFLKG